MHLSCLDFKYGVIELRSLPVSVYTAEDDTVMYTYIEEHDDHNYADDYIPNLQLNGYGVSYYQISYICAGLCFVIAGVVDMINEKSCWPIFRLVAGSSTLAAAICISGDSYTLTNTLNLTSTHFYLLDSLTLFRKKTCCAVYPTESSKWMKKYLLFGDLTYFAGSAIDVPVRQMMNEQSILFFMGCSSLTTSISTYTIPHANQLANLWVFDRTSFWNNAVWTCALIGGVLWLVCSFVYMLAFFRGDLYPTENGPQPKRLSKVVIHAVHRKSSQGEETNASADDSCTYN